MDNNFVFEGFPYQETKINRKQAWLALVSSSDDF